MASSTPSRCAPPCAPGASLRSFCACHSARLDLVICLLERGPNHTGLRFLKALLERSIPTCGAQKASAA